MSKYLTKLSLIFALLMLISFSVIANNNNRILNLNRIYKIHNTTRTLLTFAIDTNYPGQRTHILNLLLDYTSQLNMNGSKQNNNVITSNNKQSNFI